MLHDFIAKSIAVITESKVLNTKDQKLVVDLQDTLDDVHEKNQYFRTETEMNHSVLSKFLTPASKYFQSCREITVMITSLSTNAFELMQVDGELELLQIELSELGNTPKDKARKKIKTAQIYQRQLAVAGLKHQAHYRTVEIKHWNKIMEKLKKSKFDTTDVEKHQAESYKLRWKNEIAKGKNSYNTQMNLSSLNSE